MGKQYNGQIKKRKKEEKKTSLGEVNLTKV